MYLKVLEAQFTQVRYNINIKVINAFSKGWVLRSGIISKSNIFPNC